jgi:hypothetical protein
MTASSLETFAQSKIAGSVKDEKGIALPGVSVRIKGTSVGVVTDVSGKFSLTASENGILWKSK